MRIHLINVLAIVSAVEVGSGGEEADPPFDKGRPFDLRPNLFQSTEISSKENSKENIGGMQLYYDIKNYSDW